MADSYERVITCFKAKTIIIIININININMWVDKCVNYFFYSN